MTPFPGNEPTGKETQSETQRQQEKINTLEHDIRAGEKWLIWLTAAMAFFSLCGVIVGVLQWKTYTGQRDIMQRTLTEMERTGQGATDQTNQLIGNTNWLARETMNAVRQSKNTVEANAKNAQRALDATIEASRNAQRAWLSIAGVQTIGARAHKGDGLLAFTAIKVIVRNTGNTPAVEVNRHCCYFMTLPAEFKAVPDFDFQSQNAQARGVRISRNNATTFIDGEGAFPPNTGFEETLMDLGALTMPWNRMETAYIVGKITYRDIFPGTPLHTTTVCVMSKQLPPNFVVCPSGIRMN